MTKLVILASAGLLALGGSAAAQGQPNAIQGTPGSVFPYAAPQEIETINGVPCRTVLLKGQNRRVPVACAGQVAPGGPEGPLTTGSIGPAAPRRVPRAPRGYTRVPAGQPY
jgi:hypothetical protein